VLRYFRPRGFGHLCLFPNHHRPGSQVPYESPDTSHAFSTPDTTWPVSRYPPCSSQSRCKTPILVSSMDLSTLLRRRVCTHLSYPYLTRSNVTPFTITLTTAVFRTEAAYGGLKPPPTRRLRRAYLHLSHSMTLSRLLDAIHLQSSKRLYRRRLGYHTMSLSKSGFIRSSRECISFFPLAEIFTRGWP
jgi:hypothetical protein